ncbi:MAG: exodeoxyribonuclease VII large subunit, partial [Candidatus Eisenbacteria bacterium]|nr:exodeoxyribonuclease VII large subunit [Candidatus Eisenbacteria bacterium]
MAVSPASERILSVSALTRLIKDTLDGAFPAVWVKGELSGVKRADRGQLYFALKDGKDALLDCVMWSTAANRLTFEPKDGTEVEAFGAVTVYAPRGRYQLVVETLRPGGLGALLVAYEELKRRLQAEGLFDPARRKPLPRYPERIGLVTSPVGAAVRDMVKVLRTRWPGTGIVLAPVRVQGPGAAQEIASAIARFNRYMKVDLLIVGRGGGSLEDLWAFNEEPVVRAIAGSKLPVIAAIGHEVDVTLADLAADVRAATPSNAAEIAVRDRREVRGGIEVLEGRAMRAVRVGFDRRRRRLRELIEKYGFRRQRDALGFVQQRIDGLLERLRGSARARVRAARERLIEIGQRYGLRLWPRTLTERRGRLGEARERLRAAREADVQARRQRLAGFADRLRAL